ncbi:hypothetical protein O181_065709 [Austropuccinia psidii MF-1]|uniref:Wax synthase domain-containing protein n=1 Tax=Austropuccinia psidii MF-1 TaxID=1389203 RepID=A0A9Q3ES04_9BASI|nr:hypothetical protein [Austropuccinia psidii MF-1]
MSALSKIQLFLSDIEKSHAEMAASTAMACLSPGCQLKRIIPGFIFVLPLLLQSFLMHPCYENSKSAKFLRLALMPITIYLCFSRSRQRLIYPVDELFHINFSSISFSTFHSVCLAIEFGLHDGPIFPPPGTSPRKPLEQAEIKKKTIVVTKDEVIQQERKITPTKKIWPSLSERIKFTIWLLFSPRGLETSWAPPLSVVGEGPKLGAWQFFFWTLFKMIVCHIVVVASWALAVSFTQNPKGAVGVLSQYYPQLQRFEAYSDYMTPGPFGIAAWFALEELGCFMNVLEVLVYLIGPYVLPKSLAPGKFDSTLYPPLFNKLWEKDSLINFWSSGWHAIFRRHIIFCGWKPVEYIFSPFGREVSRAAGMVGAMFFSGIFHEYVVVASSRLDPKFSTIRVFTFFGLAMVLETYYKRITGKYVKGLGGHIWKFSVITLVGYPAALSWIERGLAQKGIPLPELWTWHRYLIPVGVLAPERWLRYITIPFFESSKLPSELIKEFIRQ